MGRYVSDAHAENSESGVEVAIVEVSVIISLLFGRAQGCSGCTSAVRAGRTRAERLLLGIMLGRCAEAGD